MKRIILYSFLIIITTAAAAQKKEIAAPPDLPIDDISRKITYQEVVMVKSVSADTLYKRVNAWFHEFYKNPTEVIREKDDAARKIVGKPRFRINNPPDKSGVKTDAGIVQYTITVACREGRFRYEITDINWVQLSYYPIEKWYDNSLPSYSTNYVDYLQQTDDYMNDLISRLKTTATTAKKVKSDDW